MVSWAFPEQGWRKGPWTPEEDKLLIEYVNLHGEGRWSSVARSSGLNRNGKSCRLRWVNYLRPGLRRGKITQQEEGIILELHALWGNKWSTIARYLPGRTDNEIKNYWRTHFKKKEKLSKKQQNRRGGLLKHQQGQDDEILQGSLPDHVESCKSKGNQGTVLMYPTMEEYISCPEISQDAAGTWTESNGIWGGLWNLDDIHSGLDNIIEENKPSMEYQSAAISGLGDYNNYHGVGYIF